MEWNREALKQLVRAKQKTKQSNVSRDSADAQYEMAQSSYTMIVPIHRCILAQPHNTTRWTV